MRAFLVVWARCAFLHWSLRAFRISLDATGFALPMGLCRSTSGLGEKSVHSFARADKRFCLMYTSQDIPADFRAIATDHIDHIT